MKYGISYGMSYGIPQILFEESLKGASKGYRAIWALFKAISLMLSKRFVLGP